MTSNKFPKGSAPVEIGSNKGAEIIKLDKKINEVIKKRLGAFVKEIQELKNKQRMLEIAKKNRTKFKNQKNNNKKKK